MKASTAGDLKAIMPTAPITNIDLFLPWFNKYCPQYDINNEARWCAFIANVAHESGSLKYVKEIASGQAYEGRKDLGNIFPGDGQKFRGRGAIQITGRNNYGKCSMALFGDYRLTTTPQLLEQPQYAVQSACWFWSDRGLNMMSDRIDPMIPMAGDNLKAFKAVVKRVNGWYNGLSERIQFWDRAVRALVKTPAQ